MEELARRLKKKNHICLICKSPCYGVKYCSACYSTKAQLGRIPWNKNIKTGLIPKTAFKKGVRFNPSGEFKTGEGKHFIGTTPEYKQLHYWVNKIKGKAYFCMFSSIDCRGGYGWANVSGEYKKDTSDYISLCDKHHFEYDRNKRSIVYA
jgi:hypothetical protein